MKYILLIFLLSCSISTKFKIGDCLKAPYLEVWENITIHKVINVGKRHYLLSPPFGNGYIPAIDETLIKVSCPK